MKRERGSKKRQRNNEGNGSGANRSHLGVEPNDPHAPVGGSQWLPRRGEQQVDSPYGLEEASSHDNFHEDVSGTLSASQQGTGAAESADSDLARGEGACRGGSHPHGHGHTEQKGLIRALVLATVILIVVATGGILSGSLALLSDAGHILTDVSALLLALFAIRLASRPRTGSKTYGWYRLEILAALANGTALLVIAGIIVHEAFQRFRDVPEIDSSIMMGVAAIGLVGNLAGLWFLHKDRHGSLNIRGAFLHILSDALSSVTVLVGGVLIHYTGLFVIDPVLSLLISLVIVVGAGRLVWEAVDVLLEATPAHIDHEEVVRTISDVEGVCGVHDLHIWTITSGMYALSVHVVVPPEKLEESNRILGCIKKVLLQKFDIDHTTVQIEAVGYEHVGAVC